MGPAVYFTVIDGVTPQRRSSRGKEIVLQSIREILGQPQARFEIAHAANGRPIVSGHPEVFISITHSQTSLACVVSLIGPAGIDLEVPRPHRDLAGIAAFAFGPKERARADAEGPDGFYRIWTLREAIAKADGSGLAQAADRQDRVDFGPMTGDWHWQGWHLTHRLPAPGKHLAIAVLAPSVARVDWRYITPSDA